VVHTHKVLLEEADFSEIDKAFQELGKNAVSFLPETDEPELIAYQRLADMRYVGQGYDISIPLPSDDFSRLTKKDISRMFNSTYESLYGRTSPDKVEFMHLRVIASLPERPYFQKFSKKKVTSLQSAIKGNRKAYTSLSSSYVDFTVYDRYQLVPGATFDGPAIIEEKESTTVLGQDATASIDEYGNIVLTLRRK
jgi:N-methylhydantoinase A/oxoprolinase/acetone carboxylase beta subunit